jgi:hypothetical protein
MLGSKSKRATNKTDVQLAGCALLLAVWKFVSLYGEYKDSQKEEATNESA